ncbi:MAG: hypothetical protein QME74_02830 [Candidatus Edwardsbacteria bacterium]|nr:hypothetical protein [Candidatus Edwardsbacteria bacterium]
MNRKKNMVINGVTIGCVAVIVLLAAGAGIVYVQRAAIMRWARVRVAEKMSGRLMMDLPEGVDAAKARQTLDRLAKGIEQETVDQARLAGVYRSMSWALADGKLDKTEAENVLQEIDTVII